MIYDDRGNVRYTLNPLGEDTENVYSHTPRPDSTDPERAGTKGLLLPTYRVVDTDGSVTTRPERLNLTVANEYVRRDQRRNRHNPSEHPAPNEKDAVTYYDRQGRSVFTRNPLGSGTVSNVTRTLYDALGRAVGTERHNTDSFCSSRAPARAISRGST